MGFAVNEMGTDIRLDLANYKRKSLRHDFNRSVKDGYVTKECSAAEVGIEAIKDVSDRWRETRTFKDREVAFLNRPVVLEDEPDVRQFFTFDRDGKLVAFAFYDPIYEDGQVIGYSTSFKRRIPEADSKICNAILHFAIETFRAEGRKSLHLGLSPMADIEDKEFRHNALRQRGFPRRLQQQAVQSLHLPAAGPCLAQARLQGRRRTDLLRVQDGLRAVAPVQDDARLLPELAMPRLRPWSEAGIGEMHFQAGRRTRYDVAPSVTMPLQNWVALAGVDVVFAHECELAVVADAIDGQAGGERLTLPSRTGIGWMLAATSMRPLGSMAKVRR